MQIYKKNKVAQNIPTPLFLSPVRIPYGRQLPALPRSAQGKAAAAWARLLKLNLNRGGASLRLPLPFITSSPLLLRRGPREAWEVWA